MEIRVDDYQKNTELPLNIPKRITLTLNPQEFTVIRRAISDKVDMLDGITSASPSGLSVRPVSTSVTYRMGGPWLAKEQQIAHALDHKMVMVGRIE